MAFLRVSFPKREKDSAAFLPVSLHAELPGDLTSGDIAQVSRARARRRAPENSLLHSFVRQTALKLLSAAPTRPS